MRANKAKLWHLKQVNLFRGMPAELGAKVEEMTTMQSFTKGSKLFLSPDPTNNLFILKSGRVKVSKVAEDGKELIKAILYPGEIFGETGLSGSLMRGDEATALDNNVLVCAMKIDDLKTLMSMHPSLGLSVTASLGKKMARMDRQLESLIFKDAQGRVIEFLLLMAKDHGEVIGKHVIIEHNLTHQDMANLTATSRQTVTTILNDLKEEGILSIERKKVLVKDMAALKEFLETPLASD